MSILPKAQSVTKQGAADSYVSPMAFRSQVLDGGYTRLEISAPPAKLAIVHQQLAKLLSPPLKLRYVKMTDRQAGQLEKPESYVAVELSKERIEQTLNFFDKLFYHDGRNQLWILGIDGAQLVLDEIGMIYVYPDDFAFRDALTNLGWVEAQHQTMADRDYVRVNFLTEGDELERSLMQSLGLIRWEG